MREAEIEALARHGLAGRVSEKFDQIGDQNPRITQQARRMRLRRDRGDQVLDRIQPCCGCRLDSQKPHFIVIRFAVAFVTGEL